MRLVTLAVTALLVVPLAACSSGSTTATGSCPASVSSPSDTTSSGPTAAASTSAGCAALTKEDLASYLVYTQLLAQVTDAASVEALKSGAPGDYTPAKLDAILGKMANVSDDAATAATFFQQANAALGKMIEAGPTAESLKAYQAMTGGVPGVLQQQLQLNQAIGTACPKLR